MFFQDMDREHECEYKERVARLESQFALLLQEVDVLKAENAELRAELAKYRKPPKTPNNSSLPPSRERYRKPYPKRGKSERPTGGQPGHEGHHHPFAEPDVIEPVYPSVCEHCGCQELSPLEGYEESRQEVKLPPLKPVVTEHRQQRALCCKCGKTSRGKLPERLKAPVQMGESISAMVGYLKYMHHLSHERIVQFFQELFGLSISEGFVDDRLERLSEDFTPAYEAIGKALPNEDVLGSDESGQRVEGKNVYLWVFQSRMLCYFTGNTSRKFEVIENLFGGKFSGVWVSDRFGAQLKVEGKHQLCLPHILRNLQYAVDAEDSVWARDVQEILRGAIHFRKQQDNAFDPVNNQDIFRQCEMFRRRLREVFEKPPPGAEAQKLFRTLENRQHQMLLFLTDPDVPHDNNASERALRRSVVHKKVLGGFRSNQGAKRQDVLLSIIETAKRQGLKVLSVLSGNAALQIA